MDIGYIIISAAITIVSLILLVVTFHSYKIYKNKKLPFVIMVFFFFLIKGILLSLGLFFKALEPVIYSYYIWIFDLIILTLLYAASLKR